MCSHCIEHQEQSQRNWLSVMLPVLPADQALGTSDTALRTSTCDCRGLRAIAPFGLSKFNVRSGTRGTVVFEEQDGIFVVRWDNNVISIHDRDHFFSRVKLIGFSELDYIAPISRRWN